MRFLCVILVELLLLSAPAQEPNAPIVLKPRFNHSRVVLPAQLNSSGEFFFLVDSACTIPTLHPELIDELKLESSGSIRIAGIAGEERAPTYRNVSFDFAGANYSPRRVASIPSERDDSRRRRDGVVGSSFFRRFVIEIDPKAETVRLHSPTNYQYKGQGKIVPFTFRQEIPVLKASLLLKGKEPIQGDFELDTGCDSGLCLGQKFVEQNIILGDLDSRKGEKFGVGGTVKTKDIRIPELLLADVKLSNVQADCFLDGSPVDEPLAGHMGMSALKNHTIIFDYSRQRMIVE